MTNLKRVFGQAPYLWLCIGVLLLSCAQNKKAVREEALLHYSLGVDALQNRYPREALKELLLAEDKDPKDPETKNALGLTYFALKMFPEAEGKYKEAIALKKEAPEYENNLASLWIETERFEEARLMLEKVTQNIMYETPYLAEANLGWVHYKLGNDSEAVKHLKKALEYNPRFCLGHFNLGEVYSRSSDLEKVQHAFQKAVQYCPDYAAAHHRLGLTRMRLKDPNGAREALQKCCELSKEGELFEACEKNLKLLGPS